MNNEITIKSQIADKGTFLVIQLVAFQEGTVTMFWEGKKVTEERIFEDVVLVVKKQFQTRKEAELFLNSKVIKKLEKIALELV